MSIIVDIVTHTHTHTHTHTEGEREREREREREHMLKVKSHLSINSSRCMQPPGVPFTAVVLVLALTANKCPFCRLSSSSRHTRSCTMILSTHTDLQSPFPPGYFVLRITPKGATSGLDCQPFFDYYSYITSYHVTLNAKATNRTYKHSKKHKKRRNRK